MVKLDKRCCVYNEEENIFVGIRCIDCGNFYSMYNNNFDNVNCNDIGILKCKKCNSRVKK